MYGENRAVAGLAQMEGRISSGPAEATQESEVGYAMRSATEGLVRLQNAFDKLLQRIDPILRQEPPSPVTDKNAPTRGVSSPLATTLSNHAMQIGNLEEHIRSVSGRVAL